MRIGEVGEDQPHQGPGREYTILDAFSQKVNMVDHVSGQCHYIRNLAFIAKPRPRSLKLSVPSLRCPNPPRAGQGSVLQQFQKKQVLIANKMSEGGEEYSEPT